MTQFRREGTASRLRAFAVLALFAAAAAAAACGSPSASAEAPARTPAALELTPKALAGTWTDALNPDEFLLFFADGTFNATLTPGPGRRLERMTGAYIAAGDRIQLAPKSIDDRTNDLSMYLRPLTLKVDRIADGEMVVTFTQGGAFRMDGSLGTFRK